MALKEQPKSPLTVKFQQYELQSSVAFYKILVTDIDYHKTWSLPKVRYSELRKLHLQIQQHYTQQLPDFPPKKFFGNLEPSFLSQRSKALEIYLNNTLKYFNINQLPKLREFLCPDGLSERPKDKIKGDEQQQQQQQQQTAQQQQVSKENKSPQIVPQSSPKQISSEQKASTKASLSQARPDLDQMIENIKVQFIYINNPSQHEQEPYESKNSMELAKKKCIKSGQKIIEVLGLDTIKQQNWEGLVKEECFVRNDRELLEAVDLALDNLNKNCGKLNEFCKYTNNQVPMDIIHYIQPSLFQTS